MEIPEVDGARTCYACVVGTFEYFDHAADLGLRIHGASLPDLFLTGALALMEWIGPAPDHSTPIKEKVVLEADGLDELLVRWLQEVLYVFQQRRAYLTGAESIDIQGGRLSAVIFARLWGDAQAPTYQEIKAVTYHQLELCRDKSGWRASVILDL